MTRLGFPLLSVAAGLLIAASATSAEPYTDQTTAFQQHLKANLVGHRYDQPTKTFEDHTHTDKVKVLGKTVATNTHGWQLKAHGWAELKSLKWESGKLVRIDYPGMDIPGLPKRDGFTGWEGICAFELPFRGYTHGERWDVAGHAKTKTDTLWGSVHPAGTVYVTMSLSTAGAKIMRYEVKWSTKPGHDDRPNRFVKQIIDGRMRAELEAALTSFGIPVKK